MFVRDGNTIFIQKNDDGQMSPEVRAVYHHAIVNSLPYRSLPLEALTPALLSADGCGLAVGSVEFVSKALSLLGVGAPASNYYPSMLSGHLHRTVQKTRLSDLMARLVLGETWFAKSVAWKAIPGQIFRPDDEQAKAQIAGLPGDTPIWISQPVSFLSEYRCYVLNGRLIARSQYAGDPDRMPDFEVIRSALRQFASVPGAPAAYAFDWGVMEDGTTALVEVNDGWAIGLYPGLQASDYVAILQCRWNEIVASLSQSA